MHDFTHVHQDGRQAGIFLKNRFIDRYGLPVFFLHFQDPGQAQEGIPEIRIKKRYLSEQRLGFRKLSSLIQGHSQEVKQGYVVGGVLEGEPGL